MAKTRRAQNLRSEIRCPPFVSINYIFIDTPAPSS